MSLFDYPRINIKGTVTLNPGTANNDDYAGSYTLSEGPFAGQTLALIDSKLVQPRTYGMTDADFIQWVQTAHTFNAEPSGPPQQIIPAEWNYYGDMSSGVDSGAASVIGVQTGPGELYTSPDPNVPVTALIGSPLTYYGSITDVNSEGSPPATQFFIEQLTLMNGTAIALQGPASKGACQWINFYRNVNQQADAGAGGYMYHVILKSQCGGNFNIPGFDDPAIVGAIFRYYLYNIVQPITSNPGLEKLYMNQEQNAASLQFVATIAPLFANEAITTGPIGRLLVAPPPSISTAPLKNNNGQGTIALAPAVLQQNGDLISVEFVGTFPDNSQGATNDKYNFGPVTLMADGSGTSATIGAVDYSDTAGGDQRGWLFDFDITGNSAAQQVLSDPNATFRLQSQNFGPVLGESEYYIVSNQQAMYAEQGGPGDSFVNQGTAEPATISVYQYGQQLVAGVCPSITVWSYSTVPLQTPGALVQVTQNYQPGQPLSVDTSLPGNFLFTFTVGNQPPPPSSYSAFLNPPFTILTNAPQFSLRILPNDEDFSQYYVDPTAPEPVGNATLTFDIVYAKVLRTYYLLYPAMNAYIPLNSESAVAASASAIIARTDPSIWMSTSYMPRTRDMSASRRTLLQAWCRMAH
ncbi:MAG TPA: hypothetical protein VLC46_25410 [Thermoanaerobaculia bacterium]|jgi:hypothetical protein|nr:hypothetical protein [Thermoanaerobaculia bacterium]